MWLGPPYMNRKMTLFAVAGSSGGLGASGFCGCGEAQAAALKKPSPASREVRAAAPNPQPVSQRNSRRVRRQKVLRSADDMDMPSIKINKFVQVQHGEAPVLQCIGGLQAAIVNQMMNQLRAVDDFVFS